MMYISALSPSLAAVVKSYEPRWVSKRKGRRFVLTGLSECEDGRLGRLIYFCVSAVLLRL